MFIFATNDLLLCRVSYSSKGAVSNVLRRALIDLQVGKTPDTRGWIVPV